MQRRDSKYSGEKDDEYGADRQVEKRRFLDVEEEDMQRAGVTGIG